jgi:hypothetical protein
MQKACNYIFSFSARDEDERLTSIPNRRLPLETRPDTYWIGEVYLSADMDTKEKKKAFQITC